MGLSPMRGSLSPLVLPTASPPSPFLTDLYGYWRCEEATGATRLDSHRSNNLSQVNNVAQVTGRVGNGAGFVSASSQLLTIPDNSDLSIGDIDFTLDGWFWLTTAGASFQGIVAKWDSGPGAGTVEYRVVYFNTLIFFQVSANGGSVSQVTRSFSTTGTWCYFNAQHDAANNQISLSLNNGTPATAAHSGGIFNGVSNFQFGHVSGNYLNGRMDEVGLWKRLHTASEVTQRANGAVYPFV